MTNTFSDECLEENDELFRTDADPENGEKALWRAVVTQALMDAGSNSTKREMKFDRAQAISWLNGTSPDFATVCSLADLDPQYVKEKARSAIKNGCKWRQDSVKKRKSIFQQKHTKKKRTSVYSEKKTMLVAV